MITTIASGISHNFQQNVDLLDKQQRNPTNKKINIIAITALAAATATATYSICTQGFEATAAYIKNASTRGMATMTKLSSSLMTRVSNIKLPPAIAAHVTLPRVIGGVVVVGAVAIAIILLLKNRKKSHAEKTIDPTTTPTQTNVKVIATTPKASGEQGNQSPVLSQDLLHPKPTPLQESERIHNNDIVDESTGDLNLNKLSPPAASTLVNSAASPVTAREISLSGLLDTLQPSVDSSSQNFDTIDEIWMTELSHKRSKAITPQHRKTAVEKRVAPGSAPAKIKHKDNFEKEVFDGKMVKEFVNAFIKLVEAEDPQRKEKITRILRNMWITNPDILRLKKDILVRVNNEEKTDLFVEIIIHPAEQEEKALVQYEIDVTTYLSKPDPNQLAKLRATWQSAEFMPIRGLFLKRINEELEAEFYYHVLLAKEVNNFCADFALIDENIVQNLMKTHPEILENIIIWHDSILEKRFYQYKEQDWPRVQRTGIVNLLSQCVVDETISPELLYNIYLKFITPANAPIDDMKIVNFMIDGTLPKGESEDKVRTDEELITLFKLKYKTQLVDLFNGFKSQVTKNQQQSIHYPNQIQGDLINYIDLVASMLDDDNVNEKFVEWVTKEQSAECPKARNASFDAFLSRINYLAKNTQTNKEAFENNFVFVQNFFFDETASGKREERIKKI